MADIAQLYPELEHDLTSLLQRELARVRPGSELQSLYRINRGSKYGATFQCGSRTAGVTIAAEERLFMADLWDRGVQLGSANTPHLHEVAEFVHACLGKNLSIRELQRHFPFFVIGQQAQVHELGAAAEVSWQWENVKQHVAECLSELSPLVERIVSSPLNRLFPYISLEALCFSRCTGNPYSGDCPGVTALSPGDYEVRSNRGERLGRGDERTALNLLLQNLPPNCGPAIQGTANDLA